MEHGLIYRIARGILGILCFIQLIIGIVLIGGGVYIMTKEDWSVIDKTFQKVIKKASGLPIDTSKFSIAEFIKPMSKYLIGFGIGISTLSLLGWCGACNKNRKLLIVFCILFGIMFGIHGLMVYRLNNKPSAFDASLKPIFLDTIKEYNGVESTDTSSLVLNGLMTMMECCGVDSYKDFTKSDKWPPKQINNHTIPALQNLTTPLLCCKKIPDLTVSEPDLSCAITPTSSNSHFDVGCYSKIFATVVKHKYFKTFILVYTIVQCTVVVCSLWLLFIDGLVRKEEKAAKDAEDVERAEKAEKAQADKAKAEAEAKAEKEKAEKQKAEKAKADAKAEEEQAEKAKAEAEQAQLAEDDDSDE